jgi:ribonuclease BN (tRNA processing enzyme)
VELIVLGAHGTWAKPGGATSGYLLRHEGFTLWVDLGTGTMANLQRHVGLFDVGAMVISHSHPDHLVDLYPYFYARHFSDERPLGTPLFFPPLVLERGMALFGEETRPAVEASFALTEIEPGNGFEAGPFRIRTAPMAHPVPTLGLRVETDGATLAYTADTGPTPELTSLAQDADVLLSEASWQQWEEGWERMPIHLTSLQAGEAARDSGVRSLVLTHIWPTLDRARSVDEAAGAFEGEIRLAEEGMVLEVGS